MVSRVIMPKLGETMEEGEIITWLKQEGDQVKEGEPLLEIATDKANMEVEATRSGVLRKIAAKKGDVVPVTRVIAYVADSMDEAIEAEGEEEPAEAEAEQKEPTEVTGTDTAAPSATTVSGRVKASPRARKLARQHDIDLGSLTGSGPGGRIIEDDLLQAVQGAGAAAPPAEDISLSRVEQLIGQRMSQSKQEKPHFYLTAEYDLSQVMVVREQLVAECETERGVRVTYTDFLVKACGLALARYARVNAWYRDGKVQANAHVNVGLAVAREQGLVVPVIRDADRKDLFAIGRDRAELARKAREDHLSMADLEGGTFTVSNLGMMGIKRFAPIINPPEACILGVGEIKQRPVVKDGQIGAAPLMEVTLSCDHRVVDGYLGAQFLQELRRYLEKPSVLLVS